MNERILHLRIKIKSLADEAVTIRVAARRILRGTVHRGNVRHRLNLHRTEVVRHHARHNLLAYGLLRGVRYSVIEKKCREIPDWEMIGKIAKRFGGAKNDITFWIDDAKLYVKTQFMRRVA